MIRYAPLSGAEVDEINRARKLLEHHDYIVRTPETAAVPFTFTYLAKDADAPGHPAHAEVRIEAEIGGRLTLVRQSIPDEYVGDPSYNRHLCEQLASTVSNELREYLRPIIDRDLALHLPRKAGK